MRIETLRLRLFCVSALLTYKIIMPNFIAVQYLTGTNPRGSCPEALLAAEECFLLEDGDVEIVFDFLQCGCGTRRHHRVIRHQRTS